MGFRVCCCSLPDMYGSQVCEHCTNNKEGDNMYTPTFPFSKPFPIRPTDMWTISTPVKKKVITEKFDKDGKLIERITTEE